MTSSQAPTPSMYEKVVSESLASKQLEYMMKNLVKSFKAGKISEKSFHTDMKFLKNLQKNGVKVPPRKPYNHRW